MENRYHKIVDMKYRRCDARNMKVVDMLYSHKTHKGRYTKIVKVEIGYFVEVFSGQSSMEFVLSFSRRILVGSNCPFTSSLVRGPKKLNLCSLEFGATKD